MSYALQSMLRIRVMREDRAAAELTGARRARAAAEAERDERRKARAAFDESKEERRDRVYDAVMGRVVKTDELDRARAAVTRIDEESFLLAEAERQAQDDLAKRSDEESASRVRYVAASRKKAKIEQHRLAWMEEDRRIQEQAEDAEMEEFTGRRMTADDDDSLD